MGNEVKEIYVIYHTWMAEDWTSDYGYMEPCEEAVGFVWTENEAKQLIAQWTDKFLPDGDKYKEDQEFDYRKLPLALLDVSPFNRKEN